MATYQVEIQKINSISHTSEENICPEQFTCYLKSFKEHKPTTAGRIALERQAGRKTFHPAGIETTDLPIQTYLLTTRLPGPCLCYAATDFILATTFTSE